MRVGSIVLPAWMLVLVGSGCAGEGDGRTDTSTASEDGTGPSSSTSDPGSTAGDDPSSAESAGDSTDGSASESAGSTTGATLACVDESDCRLFDDCCSCEALHVDEDVPPSCDLACDRTLCQLWNTDVICSHTCLLRLVDCDPALIECADEPPACDDGTRPAILERCWTGQCVPVELCTPY